MSWAVRRRRSTRELFLLTPGRHPWDGRRLLRALAGLCVAAVQRAGTLGPSTLGPAPRPSRRTPRAPPYRACGPADLPVAVAASPGALLLTLGAGERIGAWHRDALARLSAPPEVEGRLVVTTTPDAAAEGPAFAVPTFGPWRLLWAVGRRRLTLRGLPLAAATLTDVGDGGSPAEELVLVDCRLHPGGEGARLATLLACNTDAVVC